MKKILTVATVISCFVTAQSQAAIFHSCGINGSKPVIEHACYYNGTNKKVPGATPPNCPAGSYEGYKYGKCQDPGIPPSNPSPTPLPPINQPTNPDNPGGGFPYPGNPENPDNPDGGGTSTPGTGSSVGGQCNNECLTPQGEPGNYVSEGDLIPSNTCIRC